MKRTKGDFSLETKEDNRMTSVKCWKKNRYQPRILHPTKSTLQNETIRHFWINISWEYSSRGDLHYKNVKGSSSAWREITPEFNPAENRKYAGKQKNFSWFFFSLMIFFKAKILKMYFRIYNAWEKYTTDIIRQMEVYHSKVLICYKW